MALKALLGSELLKGDATVNIDCLDGKDVIGLYFSAHWCPPCRGFTPVLVDKYKELQAAGKSFEVVFCSSDRDEGSFQEYYKEMPWLALPFNDRELKQKLSKKYKVSGIPSLVLLDRAGKVITKDGRSALTDGDAVENFPFTPPTLAQALGDTFTNGKGESVSLKSLQDAGTYIALYFSAHWCPPCRGFTPELVKSYNKLKAAGKPFEIIFVSSDQDASQFEEYFGEMPWLALPYEDRKRKAQLSKVFEVQGIPSLVMLDSALKLVNKDAKGSVSRDVTGEEFPWYPKLVMDVEDATEFINDTPVLVAMMEEAAEHWDAVEATLTAAAKLHSNAATNENNGSNACSAGGQKDACSDGAEEEEEEGMKFAVAKETGGIAGQIRKLFKMGKAGDKPELVLTNLGDNGSYYVHDGGVDEESVLKLIQSFKDGALQFQSLKN